MDFTCCNCGKTHAVMTIVDGEMNCLNCINEDESNAELEEVVIEE